jgi:hypothetical protein
MHCVVYAAIVFGSWDLNVCLDSIGCMRCDVMVVVEVMDILSVALLYVGSLGSE